MGKKKNAKPLAGVRGIARDKHFAEGGDIAGWRGRARRFADEKKQANKKACRGKFEE